MIYISAIAAGMVFSAAFYFYFKKFSENTPYLYGGFLLISGLTFGVLTLVACFHSFGVEI